MIIKKLHWMLITLSGLLGLTVWWLQRPSPLTLSMVQVEKGLVEQTVSNTRAGTIEACRRAGLSPSAGGQIAALPVREGDRVQQGQLLLELWNKDLDAQLELAEQEAAAARATAKARCIESEQAEREARRLLSLGERHLVAEDQAEQAQSSARASDAACEAARLNCAVRQAQVAVARASLEKTRLVAPFAGVIAQINGELSEYVTPSPIGIATPPAIDLMADGCFYLTAPIDEVDVAAIRIGQAAKITLDAFGGQVFPGEVRRIADYVLDLEKQARTVEVEVEFSNPADQQSLLAGYSADVEIILQRHPNTLRVPSEAVRQQQQVYIWNPDSGTITQRQIVPGLANWDYIEVLSGIKPGEWVVTSLQHPDLHHGARAIPAKPSTSR